MDKSQTRKSENILLIMIALLLLVQSIMDVRILNKVNSIEDALIKGPNQSSEWEGLEPGLKAPSFSLSDHDRRTVSLEDYRGIKIVLIFTSPNCKYCQRLHSELAELKPNIDAQIILISFGTHEQNQILIESREFHFPVLSKTDQVLVDYQILGTPTIYFIDENMKIFGSHLGYLDPSEIETFATVVSY